MSMEAYRLGLIGFPLDHSVSPAMHNAALAALHLEGEYRLYPVPPLPGGAVDLEHYLNLLRAGDLAGLNVTIPHKQSIIPSLDGITPAVDVIGAANTIFCQEDLLIGDNTDAPGFISDLNFLGWIDLGGAVPHALILGSGGSARAVAYALAELGWSLTISARRKNQAEELAASVQRALEMNGKPVAAGMFNALLLDTPHLAGLEPSPDLIINTTPLGMSSYQDRSPWPENLPFPPQAAVYDLVYNPPDTSLIKAARNAGLPAVNGLGMLVEQAALSFEIWTGRVPPRDIMRRIVDEARINSS